MFSDTHSTANTQQHPGLQPGCCNYTNLMKNYFNQIGQSLVYGRGAIVFKEGDAASGAYLLRHGRAKLFTSAADGRVMMLKVAESGDILGLSATLNQLPYEVTAVTLESCSFTYIDQSALLKFMETHAEAGYSIALALAKEHREVFQSARRLALSSSAAARVAQILIGFAASNEPINASVSFSMMLSHAELASMAGISRETVTRLINQFEREGIISRSNSTITIHRWPQLEELAD